ncbi:MAG: DUF3810 domain-containing protein [Clostridia bacterium]|nr:DUF3810 domain-containing protein [Clostridia bacterium]
MSDIIRVKRRSKRRGSNPRRTSRAKSLVSISKKFQKRFPRLSRFIKKSASGMKRHRFFATTSILLIFGALFTRVFLLFPYFAKDYSDTVGHFLRITLGTVFSLCPISVGELFFLAFLVYLPIWFTTLIFALKRKYALRHIHRKMRRVLLAPVAAICIVLCIFFFTFAPSYYVPTAAKQLGISESDIYDGDLYATLEYFVSEINADIKEIEFDEAGFSKSPISFSVLSTQINHSFQTTSSFKRICPGTGVPAKQFLLSPVLTKFGIAGIYTFYTGEANINTAVPDVYLPFNTAHELAHQRGIASENDADFVAFITCASSTDSYTRYSGHLNALGTMMREIDSALTLAKETDAKYAASVHKNVKEILSKLDERAKNELDVANEFWQANHSPALTQAASDLNDTYLKAQGQSAGVASYHYLTALIVNFYTHYLA